MVRPIEVPIERRTSAQLPFNKEVGPSMLVSVEMLKRAYWCALEKENHRRKPVIFLIISLLFL